MKALAAILGEGKLKKNGIQLVDWSWQPPLTLLESKRSAIKAADDSANVLKLASEGAKKLGDGATSGQTAGTEAAVRYLVSSMLQATRSAPSTGRGRGWGARSGGRGRGGAGRGWGRGSSN
jgi:hypothetical protein